MDKVREISNMLIGKSLSYDIFMSLFSLVENHHHTSFIIDSLCNAYGEKIKRKATRFVIISDINMHLSDIDKPFGFGINPTFHDWNKSTDDIDDREKKAFQCFTITLPANDNNYNYYVIKAIMYTNNTLNIDENIDKINSMMMKSSM
jgi:hypothetical protein